jgi:recombinational DNA repair protein RecT
MALKTVIHRLVKTLPMNMMATQAIAHSERADFKLDEAIDDTPVLTEAEKARVRELQGVQVPPEPEKAPEPPPNDGSEEGLDGWLESQ